jgi:hypothetical protein
VPTGSTRHHIIQHHDTTEMLHGYSKDVLDATVRDEESRCSASRITPPPRDCLHIFYRRTRTKKYFVREWCICNERYVMFCIGASRMHKGDLITKHQLIDQTHRAAHLDAVHLTYHLLLCKLEGRRGRKLCSRQPCGEREFAKLIETGRSGTSLSPCAL